MTDAALQNLPAEQVLAELGAQIGIPGLKFDSAGGCQLAFDGKWLVTLVYVTARQRWILSCPLATRHTTLASATQHAMLRANFMGSGCGGGTLAVSPDSRPTLHFQFAHAETSARTLLDAIEALLNQAETWAERLRTGESAPHSNAVAPLGNSTGTPADGDRPPVWMLDRV